MAKLPFDLRTFIGRLLVTVMVVLLVPFAWGLLSGVLDQLDRVEISGGSTGEWVRWGFGTYIALHILLYRATGLFRISHRLFSVLAEWLFGSQVASVDQPAADGARGKSKGRSGKSGKDDAAAKGSTMVAFSPYVIPVYAILVCVVGWALREWLDAIWLDAPICFLVGLAMGFHWLMTADELQQQRSRWYLETYLLAIGIVFILTVWVAAAFLPLVVPEFSFLRALSDGMVRAQEAYGTIVNQLFF
jgi:hypothetical protein